MGIVMGKNANKYFRCINRCNRKHDVGSDAHSDCHDVCDDKYPSMATGPDGDKNIKQPTTSRKQLKKNKLAAGGSGYTYSGQTSATGNVFGKTGPSEPIGGIDIGSAASGYGGKPGLLDQTTYTDPGSPSACLSDCTVAGSTDVDMACYKDCMGKGIAAPGGTSGDFSRRAKTSEAIDQLEKTKKGFIPISNYR